MNKKQSAFTLVELLVVITIIGVLVALLIPAIGMARAAALRTRIAGEVNGAAEAIEIFKNEVSGGSYPPDAFFGDPSDTTVDNTVRARVLSDFKRFFNKAFPKHREPPELLEALIGGTPNPNNARANTLQGGMSPAEAVVFWMQRFSTDPRYPLSGEGGPSFITTATGDPSLSSRNWITNPDDSRLGPRDENGGFLGDRQVTYIEPFDRNGNGSQDTLRINFWQYYPAGSEQPLVYFDASRGMRDIVHPELEDVVYSIKQRKAGATSGTIADLRLANEGKFQVLHAGIDGEWGDFATAFGVGPNPASNLGATYPATLLLFPDGPFIKELGDTVANFAENTTLENSQP